MAQLGIAFAGAAAGHFAAQAGLIGASYLGISAASWGWTAGSLLGNALFGPQARSTHTYGPQLKELGVTASTYGKMRPITYGTAPVEGNIIDASPRLKTAHTQTVESGGKGIFGGGSSSASHTTYTYSIDLAVGLGEGPIGGVLQIFANEILIYDATAGNTTRQPAWLEFKVYRGTETQQPDPTLEALHGEVPAYLGEAYVVFKTFQLTELFGNTPPSFRFIITPDSTPVVNNTDISLGTAISGKGLNQGSVLKYDDRTGLIWVVALRDWTTVDEECIFAIEPFSRQVVHRWVISYDVYQHYYYQFRSLEFSGWIEIKGNVAELHPLILTASKASGTGDIRIWCYNYDTGTLAGYYNPQKHGTQPVGHFKSAYTQRIRTYQYWAPNLYAQDASGPSSYTKDIRINWPSGWDDSGNGILAIKQGELEGAVVAIALEDNPDTGVKAIGVFDDPDVLTVGSTISVVWGIAQLPAGSLQCSSVIYDSGNDCFWGLESGDIAVLADGGPGSRVRLHKVSTTGVLLATYDWWVLYGLTVGIPIADTRPYLYYDSLSNSLWLSRDENGYEWNLSTLESPTVYNGIDGGAGVYYHRETHTLFHVEHGSSSVNLLVHASQVGSLDPGAISLQTFAEDVCDRCGFDPGDINATGLASKQMRGYVIDTLSTGRAILEPARTGFLFDYVEDGTDLSFILRGGSSIATLTADDLGASIDTGSGTEPKELVTIEREHNTTLPTSLDIRYMSYDRKYEIGTQSAQRLASEDRNNHSLDMPIVFSDTEAMQLVDILQRLIHIERINYRVDAMPIHSNLLPTNIITLNPAAGDLYQMRISEKLDEGGVVHFVGPRDVTSIYTSYAVGATGNVTDPSIPVVGLSILYIIDSPSLRVEDIDGGVYCAAFTYAPGYPGSTLYNSTTGSSYSPNLGIPEEAVTGYIREAPDNLKPWSWDRTTILTVQLTTGTLSSVTPEQCLAGANAALWGQNGRWSILQFSDADLQADGTYLLTNLIHGAQGTEGMINSHVASDIFILIDADTLRRVKLSASLVGSTQYYKAVTIGRILDETYAVVHTLQGGALKPWPPVDPIASWSANDITLSWTRRDKIKARMFWNPTNSEADESWEIDILDDTGAVKLTLTSTTDSVIFEDTDQITYFGEYQKHISFKIYQMSDTVGRGYPHQGIIYIGESGYPDEVLSLSPVVYWNLNENSGTTAADLSGNGWNGTITADTELDTLGALPGLPYSCFRSTEDSPKSIQAGPISALNVGTYSWSGFIYLESLPPSGNEEITNTTGGSTDRSMRIGSDGKLIWYCAGNYAYGTTVLDLHTWYHVVGTVGVINGMVIYLDKVSDGTHANTAAHTGASKTYNVYGHTDITIKVDQAANFITELTSTQVSDLYDAR